MSLFEPPSDRKGISPKGRRVLAALDAKPCGTGWVARCPAHDDRHPSLSISLGRNYELLLHCFSGCSFSKILRAIDSNAGPNALGKGWSLGVLPCAAKGSNALTGKRGLLRRGEGREARNCAIALRIWSESQSMSGTPVERYLCARRITITPPACLRFHPSLRHPSGKYIPAMVAAVSSVSGDITAVHRTYLLPRLKTDKLMLGPCAGGAVRLAPVAAKICIAEGIETALSAMQMSGLPSWAALSTSGVRSIRLPPEVREVVICADGDEPGHKAARTAAVRLTHEGRIVRIAEAPVGSDFNDVLRGRK